MSITVRIASRAEWINARFASTGGSGSLVRCVPDTTCCSTRTPDLEECDSLGTNDSAHLGEAVVDELLHGSRRGRCTGSYVRSFDSSPTHAHGLADLCDSRCTIAIGTTEVPMATKCPCGCGDKVPFGKGGAAKGYLRFVQAREVADPIFAEYLSDPTVDEDTHELIGQWRDIGRGLEHCYLAHLHREASPDKTPDLLTVHRSQQEWEGMATDYLEQITGRRLGS